MRKFYSIILSVFCFAAAYAQPNEVIVNKGDWKDGKTWSLKRIPQNGDVVTIPKDYTVVVKDNIKATDLSININIYGALELTNGKLEVGYGSKITLFEGGKILTEKNNSADKIMIGQDVKYTGAEGDVSGFRVASMSTGLAPNGFLKSEPSILPVKFAHFGVTGKNSEVLVQWSTVEEVNAAYFEVQRSYDGLAWAAIGRVTAVGNSTQLNQYSFSDRNGMGTALYYRIRQVDHDGKMMYTTVQSFKNPISAGISILAAPQKVGVQFAQPVKGRVELQIVSANGYVVARQLVDNASGLVLLNKTASLKGNYFITVSNGQDVKISKQVIL